MFKFVPAEPGRSGQFTQKRRHTQGACQPCRKKKKRCHHHHQHAALNPSLSPPVSTSDIVRSKEHRVSYSPISIARQAPSPPLSEQRAHDTSETGTSINSDNVAGEKERNTEKSAKNTESLVVSHENIPHVRADPPRDNITSEALGSQFIGDLSPASLFLAATDPGTTRDMPKNDGVGVWLTTAIKNGTANNISSALFTQSPSSLLHNPPSLIRDILVPILEKECLSQIPRPDCCEVLSRIYFEKIHPIFPVIDKETLDGLTMSNPSRILLQMGIYLAASKNSTAKQYLLLPQSQEPLSCRKFGENLSASMRLMIELGLVTNKLVLIQALTLMSQFTDELDGGDLSSQLCMKAVHGVQSIGLHLKSHPQCESRAKYGATLFCCVWAIDRMNSAFHGRPVMMYERDFSRSLHDSIKEQDAPFRLLLEITLLLDKVIDLYRPTHKPDESTSMEDTFPSFEELALGCSSSSIATPLLATIEVFYHAVAILSSRHKSWDAPQGLTTSTLRQTLSSLRLTSAVGRDLREQLSLFPFIPYAVSLGLSVSYRELRRDKLLLHRARARSQLQANCDILSDLKDVFWTASFMADMGKKVIDEMDRVLLTVAGTDHRTTQTEGANPRANTSSNVSTGSVTTSMLETEATATNPLSETHDDGCDATQEYNSFLFESMPNIDVFDLFDPSFGLDGIDACLEGNLDPYIASTNRQTDFFDSYGEVPRPHEWQSGWGP